MKIARRTIGALGIGAIMAGALLGAQLVGTPAVQAETESGRGSAVDIVAMRNGFNAPTEISPGMATMRIRTTEEGGNYIGLAQLPTGASIDEFIGQLKKVFGDDERQALEAGQWVKKNARLLGGGSVTPQHPVTITQSLLPGQYYLFDYYDIEHPNAEGSVAHQKLNVRGAVSGAVVNPKAAISMVDTSDGPRYIAPKVIGRNVPISLTNFTDQMDEMMFAKLSPGATDADVQRFFETGEGWPFAGVTFGVTPISPGRSLILNTPLEPGNYAILTWVRDLDDNERRAAAGMHTTFQVN